MLFAGKTMAGTAIDIIDNPELLKPMWEEFKERVGDGYVCPIPKGVKPRPIK
jgi:aminobenzoyl-glutamate utilization protein B